MPIDGTLPDMTPADVLAVLNDKNDVGWFAYLYCGPEGLQDKGFKAAVGVRGLFIKLKVYRVKNTQAIKEWYPDCMSPCGVIVGRKGDPIVRLESATVNDFDALCDALEEVSSES